MKRLTICAVFVGLLALSWNFGFERSRADAFKTSGTGKMTFKLLYDSSHLPPEAQKVLTGAHGGFAVDLRPGKGEVYFGLKGAGIIQISGDLKSTRILPTPDEVKNANLHNAAVWTAADGTRFLSFPSNDANAVFTTTLDGKLVNTLRAPEVGVDLGDPIA